MANETLVSVPRELREHFDLVKKLRDETLYDPDEEVVAKIRSVDALTRVIKDLAKIQQEVYNSQKFAVLTQVIVNVLKDTDKELADKVLDNLEMALESYQ